MSTARLTVAPDFRRRLVSPAERTHRLLRTEHDLRQNRRRSSSPTKGIRMTQSRAEARAEVSRRGRNRFILIVVLVVAVVVLVIVAGIGLAHSTSETKAETQVLS